MQVRRASRPHQQARELSSARGAGAGGEAAEGSVQGTRRDEAFQVRGSDLSQADEEVGSQDRNRWQAEEPGPLPRREEGRVQVRQAS